MRETWRQANVRIIAACLHHVRLLLKEMEPHQPMLVHDIKEELAEVGRLSRALVNKSRR